MPTKIIEKCVCLREGGMRERKRKKKREWMREREVDEGERKIKEKGERELEGERGWGREREKKKDRKRGGRGYIETDRQTTGAQTVRWIDTNKYSQKDAQEHKQQEEPDECPGSQTNKPPNTDFIYLHTRKKVNLDEWFPGWRRHEDQGARISNLIFNK